MLRRLRQKASRVFQRGGDKTDLSPLSKSDCSPPPSREYSDIPKYFAGLSTDAFDDGVKSYTAASDGGFNPPDTDQVQGQPQAGATEITPSSKPRTVTDQESPGLAPRLPTAMASSAVARGYYRPVNPSILDGFEPEAERDASDSRVTESSTSRVPSIPLEPNSQPPPRPVFQYRATNPAILSDFGNDFSETAPSNRRTASDGQLPESTSSTNARPGYRPPPQARASDFEEVSQPRRAMNIGLRPSQTGPPRMQSQTTPAFTSITPAGSSNPYAGLIEARQNAMTTNFLRSQDSLAGGELPPYPGDEYG